MRKIKLTQGKYALVDDADYEWLNQWKWQACKNSSGNWYAKSGLGKDGKEFQISMHRLILNCKKGDGKIIDHINHNGLNNMRKNIHLVSHRENCKNRRQKAKSIKWDKYNGYWIAEIYLGSFRDKKEAEKIIKKAKKLLKKGAIT